MQTTQYKNNFYLSYPYIYPIAPVLATFDHNDDLPIKICPTDYFIKSSQEDAHQTLWVVEYDHELHLIEQELIDKGVKIPNMRQIDLFLCAYLNGVLFFCLNDTQPTLKNHVAWCKLLNQALFYAGSDWTIIEWFKTKPELDELFSQYEEDMAMVDMDYCEDPLNGVIWPNVNIEFLIYKAFKGRIIDLHFLTKKCFKNTPII